MQLALALFQPEELERPLPVALSQLVLPVSLVSRRHNRCCNRRSLSLEHSMAGRWCSMVLVCCKPGMSCSLALERCKPGMSHR